MIGGEDDDLEALLEECGAVVERPHLVAQTEVRPTLTRVQEVTVPSRTLDPALQIQGPSNTPSRDGKLADSIERLVMQNNELLKLVAERQDPANEGASSSQSKRKSREEVYDPEEPVLLMMENYKVEDDGHYNLDTKLRQLLRPINVAPSEYWQKDSFKRVDRPILGGSIYLEHITNGDVHPGTICKSHDRGAFVEIKNFLSKNSGVGTAKKKILKVTEIGSDDFAMGVQTNWSEATTVYEVMDAGFNYLAVEFMVRQYSYTALAMMRCLHDVRYFCGVTTNPKDQRNLLEDFFNDCLKVWLGSQL